MIYGEKVRQARELKGLTQQDLAAKIRVHLSAVALMEIGLYGPGAEKHIQAIAFATGFPIGFFEDPHAIDFPIGSLQFRARTSKMTRRTRAEAHRYGQTLFQVYQKLRVRLRMPELRLPRLENTSVEDAARLTRDAMGVSPDTPIRNLTNSIEHAGVVVLGLPVALDGRDAFSLWSEGLPVIAVAAGLPGDRVRFSVAHELGHLILHRAMTGQVPVLEKEANKYGGALLLPQEPMLEQFSKGVSFTLLATMKPRWGAAIQTLARRARDLNMISERQYQAVFEQMARLGFSRIHEPDNLAIPVEKPRALRQMAERLYGIPINVRKFANDMNLTPQFAQQIMDAHAEGPKPKPKPSVLQLRRGGKS